MAEITQDQLPEPTDAELQRVADLLRRIGGTQVIWGAKDALEVLVVEHRMRAERLASQRLMRATWVLAVATIALVAATVGLIYATFADRPIRYPSVAYSDCRHLNGRGPIIDSTSAHLNPAVSGPRVNVRFRGSCAYVGAGRWRSRWRHQPPPP